MPQIYSNVKPVVDEFIKKNPDLNSALKDGLSQVNEEDRNLFFLAFMQNVINSKYPAAPGFFKAEGSVNGSIRWMSSVIDEMLLEEKKYSPEAQNYIASVAVDTLLRLTEDKRVYDKNFLRIDIKNTISDRLKNNHPFPADLHDQIKWLFRGDSYASPVQPKYPREDKTRSELLNDLTAKLPSYQSRLEGMIPAHWQFGDSDKSEVRKLILRQAGTIFLQTAISSGELLNSTQVREKLKQLFGPLALESQKLEKEQYSHLSKVINRMSMPAPEGFSVNSGLFKPSKQPDEKELAQLPAFTLK